MSRKTRRALAHTTAPVALAALPQQDITVREMAPRGSGVVKPPRPSSITARSLAVVTPSTVTTALRDLDAGRLDTWCDLIGKAKRDPVVRRAYEIRRAAVAGRKFTCKAPKDIVEPAKRRNAEALAEVVNRWLLTLDVTFFMRVLDAIGTGISVHELVWSRIGGDYLPTPRQVLTREVRWETSGGATGPEWSVSVRNAGMTWMNTVEPFANDPVECRDDTPEQRRARFLIHVPTTEMGTPMTQGQMQAVIWYWLFKGKSILFWLNGAERFGNPFIIGRTGVDATADQRASLLTDLQNMTASSVGVTGGATAIDILDSKAASSTPVWSTLVDFCDRQIFIGLGVPPDLVQSGVNGSRAADTVKDGLRVEGSKTDAQLLWDAIRRDCVEPIRRYNRFPIDTPLPEIESLFDDAVAVPVEILNAGLATKNEARAGAGLPPLPDGGDVLYVPPIAPAQGGGYGAPAPAAPPPASPGGAPAASPFPPSPRSAGGMPSL